MGIGELIGESGQPEGWTVLADPVEGDHPRLYVTEEPKEPPPGMKRMTGVVRRQNGEYVFVENGSGVVHEIANQQSVEGLEGEEITITGSEVQ